MFARFVPTLCCTCALTLGCSDDGGLGQESGSEGDGAGDGGKPTSGGDDGSEGDDDPDGDPDGLVLATGIAIDALSINQGVEIQVLRGGEFLSESERVAPLIGGRPALIRAFWQFEDDFEPRELEGRLVVTYGDGTIRTFKDRRMVDRPANPHSFPGGFMWGLVEEDFAGDADIHVEIYETDGVERGPAPGARIPAEGEYALRGITRRMLLDLVVVPTCDRPAFEDWEREIFSAYLYNTFPINELAITFHEPISGGCGEYDAAYTAMPDLRYAENAPPWRYYGGLSLGECGGVAQYGDGSWAWERDAPRSFGLCDWRVTFPTVDLFAHELGHVHARDHTFEDYDYPYDGCGARPDVGFGVRPGDMPSSSWGSASVPMQQLIPKSYSGCTAASWNDFMSYAYPYWVSDYTYRKTAEMIWETSGWADQDEPLEPSPGFTLRGVRDPGGEIHWGRTRGFTGPADHVVRRSTATLYAGTEVTARLEVQVSEGHRDPGPHEPAVPTALEVMTIAVPKGVVADSFELEIDGATRRFPVTVRR